MVISFLGHRTLYGADDLFEAVKNAIVKNTNFDEKVTFFCGGYGDFDDLCARVCRSIKTHYENCEIVFVTPYMTVSQQEKNKEWIKLKLYDSILYPPLEQVPLKFAICERNKWMIDQSDFIIFYVEHPYGGAYQGFRYSQRKGKRGLNLGKFEY